MQPIGTQGHRKSPCSPANLPLAPAELFADFSVALFRLTLGNCSARAAPPDRDLGASIHVSRPAIGGFGRQRLCESDLVDACQYLSEFPFTVATSFSFMYGTSPAGGPSRLQPEFGVCLLLLARVVGREVSLTELDPAIELAFVPLIGISTVGH